MFAAHRVDLAFVRGSLVASRENPEAGATPVLTDYKIARSSRRCTKLDRPLKPGEWFWTVVIEAGDELVRQDVSAEAWTGPPEGSLAHWKNRMPSSDQRRLKLAPDAVLVDLLHQLADDLPRQELRYLLTLLLLRRRLVRPIPSHHESSHDPSDTDHLDDAADDQTTGERAAAVKEKCLHLEVVADGTSVSVVECDISPELAAKLQSELVDLLYCEAE